jgi:hypothetical protein
MCFGRKIKVDNASYTTKVNAYDTCHLGAFLYNQRVINPNATLGSQAAR